jgi:hypothetical protein
MSAACPSRCALPACCSGPLRFGPWAAQPQTPAAAGSGGRSRSSSSAPASCVGVSCVHGQRYGPLLWVTTDFRRACRAGRPGPAGRRGSAAVLLNTTRCVCLGRSPRGGRFDGSAVVRRCDRPRRGTAGGVGRLRMAGVTASEWEQMSGWDRRQAVMAVANTVESLLRGSGRAGGEPDGEDQHLASVEAGDRSTKFTADFGGTPLYTSILRYVAAASGWRWIRCQSCCRRYHSRQKRVFAVLASGRHVAADSLRP